MSHRKIAIVIAATALAALTPAAASAAQGGTVDTSYGNPQPQEEDNDYPWGLLGLLGLLGLMPGKKTDSIHVDNRTRT